MASTFRSSNPALSETRFEAAANEVGAVSMGDTMTVQGAMTKSLMLAGLLLITASYSWFLMSTQSTMTMPVLIGGLIVGLISGLWCAFSPRSAPVTAPIYALAEGLFLGGISALFAARYPGIVVQAVALTMLTLAAMLILYKLGVIRATEKFKACVFGATLAVVGFYLIVMVLRLCGVDVSQVTGHSPLAIGISLVIVGIAALNLILDFDTIETGERVGAPLYMEWYAAFGLMVTLIWLYIEILKLLARLRDR